jgi:hypothetical protein
LRRDNRALDQEPPIRRSMPTSARVIGRIAVGDPEAFRVRPAYVEGQERYCADAS